MLAVWLIGSQLVRSDVERLLDRHAAAWERRDGTAVTALYLPSGRFVYGDITYVGPEIGAFVSGIYEYEFEPLDPPQVVPTTWGDTQLWLVAWKARVTLEHPRWNRMTAEGLAIFHVIESDGRPMIRKFEFLTQP